MAERDETTTCEERLAQARGETRAAFENRALMYAHVYDVLTEELGEERAAELMKRAIHRRGLEVGERYRAAADAGDLDEVGRIFCEESACGGELFHPSIELRDEERIVLAMTSCPLADAWRRAGLPPEKVDRLCEIAATVDEGTFEGAGLELTFLDRQACAGSDTCLLELRVPRR